MNVLNIKPCTNLALNHLTNNNVDLVTPIIGEIVLRLNRFVLLPSRFVIYVLCLDSTVSYLNELISGYDFENNNEQRVSVCRVKCYSEILGCSYNEGFVRMSSPNWCNNPIVEDPINQIIRALQYANS